MNARLNDPEELRLIIEYLRMAGAGSGPTQS